MSTRFPHEKMMVFLVLTLLAGQPHAATLRECSATDPNFQRSHELYFDDAMFEDALQAGDAISLDQLSVECRAEARELRARILISLGRESEAHAVYIETYDELPDWTPSSSSPGLEISRTAEAEWRETHAGPPYTEQTTLEFASKVNENPAPLYLIIHSQADGEISWQRADRDPRILMAREQGTTVGRADTVEVRIQTDTVIAEPDTLLGSIVVRSDPWPDVTVDVKAEWVGSGPWWKHWYVIGPAVLVVGGVTYAIVTPPDDEDDPPLPEPPGPPTGRSGVPW